LSIAEGYPILENVLSPLSYQIGGEEIFIYFDEEKNLLRGIKDAMADILILPRDILPIKILNNLMLRNFLFRSFILFLGLWVISLNSFVLAKERVFFIEEKIQIKNLPENTDGLHVWVPYPVSDESQTIDDFKLVSFLDASIIKDKEYGNKILYLSSSRDLNESEIEITIAFRVNRREYNSFDKVLHHDENLVRFLKPDRLVPVNGIMKNLAEKITKGKSDDMERVRAIYDYIIGELTYSKDDPKVCGIGDSLLTLQYKKGICTDYHSLFISLVRSLGIPAKFEIGFPISPDKEDGKINGYHCWAKFYIKDKGWIPVDISEADKHPEKRDYFFSNIDENRIHLTTGRDISLKYASELKSLNFFVYPYAELNGVQFTDMDIEISFRDLKGGG